MEVSEDNKVQLKVILPHYPLKTHTQSQARRGKNPPGKKEVKQVMHPFNRSRGKETGQKELVTINFPVTLRELLC